MPTSTTRFTAADADRGCELLRKVVSGGQTGVDQAALRAAGTAGLEIGGWCPPGRLCETGVIPPQFPLVETPEDRSPMAPDLPRSLRTEWNVRDSDGTLVLLAGKAGPGTGFTVQCAKELGKPLLVSGLPFSDLEQVVRWLGLEKIEVLNVAGPAESSAPGIRALGFEQLELLFTAAQEF